MTASTCTLSFNGANSIATGATATIPLAGNIPTTAGVATVAQGTALTSSTSFTVGFAAGAGTTTNCTYARKLNVYFGSPLSATTSTINLGSNRNALVASNPPAGSATGVGIELFSNNAGNFIRIFDFTSSVTYGNGSVLTSSQTGLGSVSAGTSLNFLASPVKTAATGTAITAGSVSISIPITISYL